jgi:hypothetical protein
MLHSPLMEKPVGSAHLHEFFLTMTRQSFAEVGLDDQGVVDYVATMLTDFARTDRLYALRNARGHAIDGVGALRRATEPSPHDQPSIVRTRAMQKYVGDYALFMSGLFRTQVERRGALGYYFEEGQRSYRAVSELELTLLRTGFLFFEQLAKNFEHYSGALDYMRKAYFAPHAGRSPFAEFLRQVEGWITTGLSDN